MSTRNPRVALLPCAAIGFALLAACGGGDTTVPGGGASQLAISGGNGQVGLPGAVLPTPLAVAVTNAAGTGVAGLTISFVVTTGSATVSPAAVKTNTSGIAQTNVTFGATAGTVVVSASVPGTSLLATFVLTSGTGTTSQTCASGTPQTLAAGGVLPGVTGTGICLSGGTTGADFALVSFNGNPDNTATATLSVTSSGASAVLTPDRAPSLNVAPTMANALKMKTNTAQHGMDLQQRAFERQLMPKISSARAWYQGRGLRDVIPSTVTVGQLIVLNAAQSDNEQDACEVPLNITARVAAISTHAVVVADTANPLPTFTDAEYQAFATTFDTLINPLDTQAFGQPTDIDGNGRILIFFTKEVNKLTPKTGGVGVVEGFFQPRDLFPTATNAFADACPTSNVGEMFYVIAPDTAGVYSRPNTKADILADTPGILAHEYQHLINAARRIYINGAAAFEEVWLNEGLSHIAEELLYYRVSGNTPRQNLGISVIGASQASVDAFNNNQSANFGRYGVFLGMPSQASPYADNDNLETRGATWNLLRYLADHQGSADGTIWSQLVNTTLTGQSNLQSVFGAGYLTQIRDWATSVFADDLPGVTDARFLSPSWNMRDVWPHLGNPAIGTFPLSELPLSDAAPVSTSVFAGGAAYIRFHVPANSQASINWSGGTGPVSPLMQFTVVRSQ